MPEVSAPTGTLTGLPWACSRQESERVLGLGGVGDDLHARRVARERFQVQVQRAELFLDLPGVVLHVDSDVLTVGLETIGRLPEAGGQLGRLRGAIGVSRILRYSRSRTVYL